MNDRLPAWALKFTGSCKAVQTRIQACAPPFEDPPRDGSGAAQGEPLNVEQFNRMRDVIVSMLERSPVPHVMVTAQGFHSPDGRVEIAVKFEPIELHV